MIFTEPIRTFIDQPLMARIAVIGTNAYPHMIPIWYAREEDVLLFFSSRTARKVAAYKPTPKVR